MKCKKVLFNPCHYVYDEAGIGSEASWAFNIANRIATRSIGSVVITGYTRIESNKEYTIIELQKDKNKIDLSIVNAIKFNWQYFMAGKKVLRKNHFDIIHHVLPFGFKKTYNLLLLLGYSKRVPFVIGPIQSPLTYKDNDINRSDVQNFDAKEKWFNLSKFIGLAASPLAQYLSRKTLTKADRVIVINDTTKQLLLRQNIEEQKIIVIPPGIDTNSFSYVPFKKKDNDIIELITVSYLIKRKGIELVISALSELLKDNKNVTLRIVGDGPQMSSLKTQVKRLHLKNHVIFEGFVPNSKVQKLYSKAHIFVTMSRSESWGQMYLEAMSCGLPVISSKNAGSNTIIENGKTGFLVNQEDYLGLSKKIMTLVNNKVMLEGMGNEARKNTIKKYDWELAVIPKYLKVYNELINESK